MWINLCANGSGKPPNNLEGCPVCGAEAWINNHGPEKDCSECGYHKDNQGSNWREEEE